MLSFSHPFSYAPNYFVVWMLGVLKVGGVLLANPFPVRFGFHPMWIA
jgi:hypothetical protein